MVASGRRRERASIRRSVARDRDDESNRCVPCAREEGDKEGDKFFTNLEDRDKETDVPGGSLQTIETGSLFVIGITLTRETPRRRRKAICPACISLRASWAQRVKV